jgi:hypothetical protein
LTEKIRARFVYRPRSVIALTWSMANFTRAGSNYERAAARMRSSHNSVN